MQHRKPRQHWKWALRSAIIAGGFVACAGVAVALLAFLGRPGVHLAGSDAALVRIDPSGIGAGVVSVQATTDGRVIDLVDSSGGLVPAARLGQGRTVVVTVRVASPGWLGWLVGKGRTRTETFTTPMVAPRERVAVAAHPGHVEVDFNAPVSRVDYRSSPGGFRVLHLAQPSEVADVPVPAGDTSGWLQVAAAASPWERISSQPRTLSWFVASGSGAPVALAYPAPGSATAGPAAAISLTFDEPVADAIGAARPLLSPAVAGRWSAPDPDTLVFRPTGIGWGTDTAVTVTFPHAVSVSGAGITTATAAAASTSYHFTSGPGSVLRLQELLAELHYLPLTFHPAAGQSEPTTMAGQIATIDHPLAGTFTWTWSDTPASLEADWAEGQPTVMTKGALMAFDSTGPTYDGYTDTAASVGQIATTALWERLLTAALHHQADPAPYSYVYVSEALPEQLTLWQDGGVILTAAANTGIPEDPTSLGTYPIYLRFTVNQMRGTNPDGSPYDDTVYWINYFDGSDAVHAFPRPYYGAPQSLGCVELPYSTGEQVFGDLAIGDLVDVAPA